MKLKILISIGLLLISSASFAEAYRFLPPFEYTNYFLEPKLHHHDKFDIHCTTKDPSNLSMIKMIPFGFEYDHFMRDEFEFIFRGVKLIPGDRMFRSVQVHNPSKGSIVLKCQRIDP